MEEKLYSTNHKAGDAVIFLGDDHYLRHEHVYHVRGVDRLGNITLIGDPNNMVYDKNYFVSATHWISIVEQIGNLIRN